MRPKPSWSECFPLEIYWSWIVVAVIACGIFLFTECSPKEAHAGAYLDVAGGLTQFLITTPDGDYRQRGLPSTWDTRSLAYRVGLGWSFNERWSIQGGYVNFGTINQTAKFVGDEDYNPKGSQCVKNCAGAPTYRITDAYHGGELTVTRTFPFENYSLFVKGGGAYLMHRFTINREDGTGQSNQHYGQFPATIIGTGGCVKMVCLEVDYYHGLGGSNGFMGQDQGWPLSKEFLVSFLSIKLPFGG